MKNYLVKVKKTFVICPMDPLTAESTSIKKWRGKYTKTGAKPINMQDS